MSLHGTTTAVTRPPTLRVDRCPPPYRMPDAFQRLSVAVVINHLPQKEQPGPISEAELAHVLTRW
ncbi:hypothetical protein KIF59_06360 [Enterobacter cloacae subsp. cloacae]|nr:hypothetical protein [Enterobacter cloacae subsp. cloacae]